jgi:hypothetical protein
VSKSTTDTFRHKLKRQSVMIVGFPRAFSIRTIRRCDVPTASASSRCPRPKASRLRLTLTPSVLPSCAASASGVRTGLDVIVSCSRSHTRCDSGSYITHSASARHVSLGNQQGPQICRFIRWVRLNAGSRNVPGVRHRTGRIARFVTQTGSACSRLWPGLVVSCLSGSG